MIRSGKSASLCCQENARLSLASEVFDAAGNLIDEKEQKAIQGLGVDLVKMADRLKAG